jgi:2-phospho-L-lactate guanylyltransferase
MQWMMEGVISAALQSHVLDRLAVISPDPGVLAHARAVDWRIIPILQRDHEPGLNPAVTTGREWAVEAGAAGLLVLFADLPFVTAGDLQTITGEPAQVVIATDRDGLGTNASLVRLAGRGRAFVYQYGPGSARKHAAEAARLGLSVATIQTPGTAFDLDTPRDWRTLSVSIAEGSLARPAQLELAVPVATTGHRAGEGR